jgi:hypothetical protein
MKAKILTRLFTFGQAHPPRQPGFFAWLDRAIVPLANSGLILGISAACLGLGVAASYLLAAGVLLHLVAWFSDWWEGK